MKLTGTNSSILQAAKQPTRLEESSSLIFIYPMIVDKLLDRKWTNILRDFFTTQFTAQIKISNVLNITSQATKFSVDNPNLKKIENSAELAATGTQSDTLGLLTNRQQTPSDSQYSQYYINSMTKGEYQEKVNQFREFIRSQIQIDPRFTDTRPLISNITVENLLDIPLIIGTKSFTVDSLSLFWILFFATGQYREDFSKSTVSDLNPISPTEVEAIKTLRLDKPESFEYIKRFIKSYMNNRQNFQNYEHVLGTLLEIPPKSIPSNRITSLMASLDTDIDRAIRSFTNATNESRYSDEIGFSRNAAISIQNAYNDSRMLESGIRSKAQNLFSSFLSNYIIPTTQSVVNTIIGIDEVNVVKALSELNNDLLTQFMDIYDLLLSSVFSNLVNQAEGAVNQLDNFEQMCQANSRLSVVPILQNFKTLRFELTSERKDIVNFIENLSRIAAQLDGYRQGLENNLIEISMDTSDPSKRDVNRQNARDRLKSFTGQHDRTNAVYNIFYQFFKEKNTFIANNTNAGPVNPLNRITQFLGQTVNIETYLQQICSSLSAVSIFMAYYVFFSYLCEFIGEIKAKVDIQKKDALDFPNYCLVIRKEVVEALYMALAVKNYNDQKAVADYKEQEDRRNNRYKITKYLQDDVGKKINTLLRRPTAETPTKPITNFTNFKIAETDISNMIRVLNSRLNVPNLIVVDDKTDTIYYKWMYSGAMVQRLNFSTLNNYIKHQQEVLPGY